MFFSFTAALVAMLFFTKTVETPQQLIALVMGGKDSTEIGKKVEEYRQRERRRKPTKFKLED
jgi:hypothetical protein